MGHAFDYLLIDESQDFPDSFFELSSLVVRDKIFIAGDIFQNIFTKSNISKDIDFLLNKSYRTDPKTLMFAHLFSMGFIENKAIGRFLTDVEWFNCGYIISKDDPASKNITVTREPIRRFEDIDELDSYSSISLVKTQASKDIDIANSIIEAIKEIKEEFNDVVAEDIAVILIDDSQYIYNVANHLNFVVALKTGFNVNLAYLTKDKKDGVFVSNRNNVKGLEFPFVICVSKQIQDTKSYRNTLYMSLTRSFIKSILILPMHNNIEVINVIEKSLKTLSEKKALDILDKQNVQEDLIQEVVTGDQQFNEFILSRFQALGISDMHMHEKILTGLNFIKEDFKDKNITDIDEIIKSMLKVI